MGKLVAVGVSQVHLGAIQVDLCHLNSQQLSIIDEHGKGNEGNCIIHLGVIQVYLNVINAYLHLSWHSGCLCGSGSLPQTRSLSHSNSTHYRKRACGT